MYVVVGGALFRLISAVDLLCFNHLFLVFLFLGESGDSASVMVSNFDTLGGTKIDALLCMPGFCGGFFSMSCWSRSCSC